MNRDGLLIAAGIIGALRGAFGTFMALPSIPDVGFIDRLVPGYGVVFGFELLVSVAVLIISIWVLVRANAPTSASDIKGWGIVIVICGIVDFMAALIVVGPSPQTFAAAFGSLAALGLIGGLLIAGAARLARAQTTA